MWALLLLVACGGSNPAREAIEHAKAVERPASAGWTCPMHPEIHQDGPGACPKCGMPLIEERR